MSPRASASSSRESASASRICCVRSALRRSAGLDHLGYRTLKLGSGAGTELLEHGNLSSGSPPCCQALFATGPDRGSDS